MATDLGIDVGTSAVKAVLVDENQAVLGEATVPLLLSTPNPSWSEQDPEAWWQAVDEAVTALRAHAPEAFAAIRAIGLSGQMHGAVLLGADSRPLRPAILWNDGRSFREAGELEAAYPGLASRMGVRPMAGFTAPKLLWLNRHEPELFARIRTILLPKDYIRLKLTGERVTDLSDAAGTWWLDQASRSWSAEALQATHLDPSHLPRLVEGTESSGTLRGEIARRWGLTASVIVAGGGGDAAAGAVGIGAVADGAAFLSLGTSGQLFVSTREFRPSPETLVHAFCHAVPERWFQMAAMLNGASPLAWVAGLLGSDVAPLLDETEQAFGAPGECLFLPYLTGERTPYNDPHARGVFFDMTPQTNRAQLVQAVLEGVAFSFADAKRCLDQAGTRISTAGLIGGGARSRLWTRILASVLDIPITRYQGGDKGPAFGAARLARIATTGEAVDSVCTLPPVLDVTEPERALVEAYKLRIEAFRSLYAALKPEFAKASGG